MAIKKSSINPFSWTNHCKRETISLIEGSSINKTEYAFFGMFNPPSLPDQNDDIDYIVKQGDRLDSLAYDYYGTHLLWWVIALKNDIDLPSQMFLGRQIVIPSPRFVRLSLGQ